MYYTPRRIMEFIDPSAQSGKFLLDAFDINHGESPPLPLSPSDNPHPEADIQPADVQRNDVRTEI